MATASLSNFRSWWFNFFSKAFEFKKAVKGTPEVIGFNCLIFQMRKLRHTEKNLVFKHP